MDKDANDIFALAQVNEKARDPMEPVLGQQKSAQLIERINAMEHVANIADLRPLFTTWSARYGMRAREVSTPCSSCMANSATDSVPGRRVAFQIISRW